MNRTKQGLRAWALLGVLAGSTAHAELNDGYGVAVGKPTSWGLEAWTGQPGLNGKWPHYIIHFNVNGTDYKAAVDMSTSSQTAQVRHREISLPNAPFDCASCPSGNIFALPDGWKPLAYNDAAGASSSGALDFLRSPRLLSVFENAPWRNETDNENLIEYIPANPVNHQYQVPLWDSYFAQGVKRIFVFGEPFTSGSGVHNIHQNQGDTVAGGHSAANGIYQDGAFVLEFNQPHVIQTRTGPYTWPNRMIVMTRFAVQEEFTNDTTLNQYGFPVVPSVDVHNDSVASGAWKWYGPYTARQIQLDLTNAVGRPAIYVKYGAWPALNSYNAQADVHVPPNNDRAFLRLDNTSGLPVYVGVNACCGQAASWEYTATYHQ